MKHRWVRWVRRGGLQVRPKSWNKLSASEVQNGTLFKWMDRGKTFRHCLDQRGNSTLLLPDPHRLQICIRRMCVNKTPKYSQWRPGAFFPTLRKLILFYYTWDVIYWEKCLGSCQIIECQIWGSPEISEEEVRNHKLMQQGNKPTKEMLHCAWNIEPISPFLAF